ncbi:MAG: DUF4143 domain-containing protein [Clostridia bacterium]|nr:DUF4143 domain-containing protein [Deltaproteobacteria bacterium]
MRSYATVYFREEIQAEAVTRDIGSYARFLDVAAEASGQWINYSKIASDTEIPKETIRRFFQILEDTLLAFRITPFESREKKRRVSQRDRFVFFDPGVRNALLGLPKLTTTELGSLFEQWLILQIVFYARANHLPWKISAYRTDGGAEVDIILDTGAGIVAIECKYGRTIRTGELSGLRAFLEEHRKSVRGIVVFRGTASQKIDARIDAIPIEVFLNETLVNLH